SRFCREGVEDQLILEKDKRTRKGVTREQIESRIVVPHHTIFLQFFPSLYFAGHYYRARLLFFSLLGFM
ncbi:hypothetical protein SEE30663_18918, partial [Salmonella enterica subsp. enterica serovar Enteritidis str. SE30663]